MKSELVRELSSVEPFDNPKVSIEQYMTPPQLAADLIFAAYMNGDIEEKKILDAGCGTGILGIGASLMGGKVKGIEKDEEALKIAERNAERIGVEIDFINRDFRNFDGSFDTCVMNPPFSVHSNEGESFIKKAFEVAENIYSLGDQNLEESIKRFAEPTVYEVVSKKVKVGLPATYRFHTEESRETEVYILTVRKR